MSRRRQPKLPDTAKRSGRQRGGHEEGFTLLEVMVVAVILLATLVVGYPAIDNVIHRTRMLSYTREVSIAVARARQEAIRRGAPVVVTPRYAQGDLFAFVNVDLDPSLSYDPDPSQPFGTVDYELLSLPVPNRAAVKFHGPADGLPEGPDAIDGLTVIDQIPGPPPDNNPTRGIVFEQDGSVRDVGAIRIADRRGNYLEVRVAPAATGRVNVLKWNSNPAWGGPPGYYEQGHEPVSGKSFWVWYDNDL